MNTQKFYNKRKNGTQTSAFGTPGRINHDSSRFYGSKLYSNLSNQKEIKYIENEIDPENINKIFCKSSESMSELPDNSVHLMITSPPYNVGKEYDQDLSLEDYRKLLKKVFTETYRVLVPGGRACINVANLGRKPYIPLHSCIIQDMSGIGFLMRGEILWNKASSASPSTAWGTWLKANNPVLRDIHEYILVFCKDTFTRANPKKRKSTISKEEFLEFTKSIWTFSAEQAKNVGHPAPFPVELPYRLIQLYTFEGEAILDPFVGSGTTCIAALKTKRRYIGYDIDESYVSLAQNRVRIFLDSNLSLFEDMTVDKTVDDSPKARNVPLGFVQRL
jgi:site-specific DNA-methyltransferase (adenine-specific)